METIEERVDTLEDILSRFITQTNSALLRLERAIEANRKRSEEERKKDRIEWKEKIAEDDRKRAKKMKEWDRKAGEDDRKRAEDAKERKETEARWARDRMELNKKWGELAVKTGTIVEDIVAPNIPRIAKEYFGCANIDHFAIRVLKRHPTDKSKRREFDVIAVCSDSDKVIFNETKSTIRPEDIRGLIRFLKSGEFFDYFPEYQGKKLIPIFSSLHISSNTVKTLSKNRIYAMVMGDETMTIINFEAVSSKDEECRSRRLLLTFRSARQL
ncbi:hypothetical protein M1N63_02635 [Thermodesulfovibrionales bacterium]|nr:hypothetical protein [Thermodesulfovibrionales bacterium]